MRVNQLCTDFSGTWLYWWRHRNCSSVLSTDLVANCEKCTNITQGYEWHFTLTRRIFDYLLSVPNKYDASFENKHSYPSDDQLGQHQGAPRPSPGGGQSYQETVYGQQSTRDEYNGAPPSSQGKLLQCWNLNLPNVSRLRMH